ncbi:MAG: HD domain-containing protein [Butyrivibrio sp.]|nr:HD domain-containing protein [Butyrivibrio sp.]
MFDFIRTYQLDIMLGLSAACISFAILLFFTQFLGKRRKIILICMEFIATLLLFSDRMAYLYSGDTSRKAYIMVRVSNFLVFLLTSAIVFTFDVYLIDLVTDGGKTTYVPYRLYFVAAAAIVGMLLVVLSQFTGTFYYFDENNVYHRGPGFLISYLIPIIGPFVQYSVIRENKKKFSKLTYISLVLYIFVPIIAAIIQVFAYGLSIVNMAMVLVSISLYVFTYLDINKDVVRAHQIEVGELKEGEQRMKRLFDQTTTAFVMAIEKKDVFARGHSERVANIARRIAEMAGKDPDKCEEVYYAALLHDVGTIGISDYILDKKEDLTEEETAELRRKPVISAEIVAGISEYPYLMDGVLFSHERYDGSGYPKGLKGKEIPEIARIIGIADAYDYKMTPKRYREALPYPIVREEFVESAGTVFDPEFADMMIHIMDQDNAGKEDEEYHLEKELLCGNYKSAVSTGILLSENFTKIRFYCEKIKVPEGKFSAPSIILFDSYNKHFHNHPKAIDAYKYHEYGELWFDGHYNSTKARNMEVVFSRNNPDSREFSEGIYEICAAKYSDHVTIQMTCSAGKVEATVAIDDESKEVYIGITGENCFIQNIEALTTEEKLCDGDFKRISHVISYIDRIESDLPNIQINKTRSEYTKGIKLEDDLRLYFHYMSLPSATLVWHCAYIVIFYSENGMVNGPGYTEYALIKLNGEISGEEDKAENKFTMKRNSRFLGWEKWKMQVKEGDECEVAFYKRGKKISTVTENLGIEIDNTTTIFDEPSEVYVALTGDEVAITDIRVMH